MIRVELSPEALARVRVTYSPMWEVTTSLRLLVHEPDSARHLPWIRWARPRLPGAAFELLGALISSPYDYPDFLTPTPGPRPRSFANELAAISGSDPERIRTEIETTA